MTKLEKLVVKHPKWTALGKDAPAKEKQKVLDEITDEVIAGLSADDICSHVRDVYDATTSEYVANPHNQGIIDELIQFMDILPDGADILDVGCGPGRDTFFMSVRDAEYRKNQMTRPTNGKTTLEKFSVPSKVFKVTAVDSSEKMLALARIKKDEFIVKALLPPFSFANPYPYFSWADMHDIYDPAESLRDFDAIWSCTALFTHTPKTLIRQVLTEVASTLKHNGIFFTSYTNGLTEGKYDKLKLSETGRIKYFSQPDPAEIAEVAAECGLRLECQSFSDLEAGGKVIKPKLYVSQFFRKVG